MVDNSVHPIRNDAEYRATLGLISAVFESGKALPSESPEWNRISALLAQVDAWEKSVAAAEEDEAAAPEPAARQAPSGQGATARIGRPQPFSVGQHPRAAPEIRSLMTDLRFAPSAA